MSREISYLERDNLFTERFCISLGLPCRFPRIHLHRREPVSRLLVLIESRRKLLLKFLYKTRILLILLIQLLNLSKRFLLKPLQFGNGVEVFLSFSTDAVYFCL